MRARMLCAARIGIARQKPDAPKLARLRTWHSLRRFVKRGEKGILLLAPMIGRKKVESAAELTEDAKPSSPSWLFLSKKIMADVRPELLNDVIQGGGFQPCCPVLPRFTHATLLWGVIKIG